MNPDIVPFVSTVGAGFLAGALLGYAIKKVVKFIAVIAGLFIAALAYLEYQHILTIDWARFQTFSEEGLTAFENMISELSNNVGGGPHIPSQKATSDSTTCVVPLITFVVVVLLVRLLAVRGGVKNDTRYFYEIASIRRF